MSNPYDDPNVRQAIADGRQPSEISLIACPRCGVYGYYNDGSHWTCRDEKCGYRASGRKMDMLIDNGEVTTLDDWSAMQVMEDKYP
jgi:hypothetical protein